MQRFACLLIGITAACGGGTDSGPASLTGPNPPGKSVGARVFTGPDGNMVDQIGWKLEFFEQGPGADCLSADTRVVAALSIYTATANDGTDKHAQLQIGDIPIVTVNPPPVSGNAAAYMSAEGVAITSGIVTISEYHLLNDKLHADRIKGTITAGGMDGTGNAVSVTGTFDAPYCPEED